MIASFMFDGASHGFDRDFLEIGELDTFLVEDGRPTASDRPPQRATLGWSCPLRLSVLTEGSEKVGSSARTLHGGTGTIR